MIQRLFALQGYLTRRLAMSLAGVLYIIVALAYYAIMFQQPTPETDYFVLVIGVFGAATTFLVTLSLAARANQASSYPLVVRLPSRVEFLTAVLLSAVTIGTLLELLVAVLALLRHGPDLSIIRALEIPPLWLTVNILAACLALHASDFVADGWSRVYLFGLLAILLFSQDGNGALMQWLGAQLRTLSNWTLRQGWVAVNQPISNLANWLTSDGSGTIRETVGVLFWPFQAMADATIDGRFSRTQAFAPAMLLLYATLLFLLAADLFATKDLYFTEE